MSISAALSNALSGLTVNSRSLELVSSNVANAATKGYARREGEVASAQLGGRGDGVRWVGVQRIVNQPLLNDLRVADGKNDGQSVRLGFLQRLGESLGQPGDTGSLTERMTRLESTLVETTTQPSNPSRLAAVLQSAGNVGSLLNGLSAQVQSERLAADKSIADQVDTLTTKLGQVHQINLDIRALGASGDDVSALKDQRQLLIDDISKIVPVREIPRENQQVALMTLGGLQLLDGGPAQLSFQWINTITPDMTLQSGALFSITLNGQPLPGGIPGPALGGGSLEASFDVRDRIAPEQQAILDGFARELVEQFSDPATDPTLASGDPGLFTDAGGAFDPLDEVGLAGRIAINPLADPAQGGALWRLQAGFGALAPVNAGDNTRLVALVDTLSRARTPSATTLGVSARSPSEFAADITSRLNGKTASVETDVAYSQTRTDALRTRFLSEGVDTDQEMQKLLVIEQAYAANARVMSTADQLIQMLMGLGA